MSANKQKTLKKTNVNFRIIKYNKRDIQRTMQGVNV